MTVRISHLCFYFRGGILSFYQTPLGVSYCGTVQSGIKLIYLNHKEFVNLPASGQWWLSECR